MGVFFYLKLKFFLLTIKNTLRKKIVEIFKKICYNYNRIKEKGENKNGWKTSGQVRTILLF